MEEHQHLIHADDGVWERKKIATFGDGSGIDNAAQVYWENQSTKATRWDRPTPSSSHQRDVLPDVGTAEGREAIVHLVVEGEGEALVVVAERLQLLEEAIQKGGSNEEWQEIVKADDASLLDRIIRLLEEASSSASTVAAEAAAQVQNQLGRILLLLSGLFPSLIDFWSRFVKSAIPLTPAAPASMRESSLLMETAISALKRLTKTHDNDASSNFHEARQVWLTLLSQALPTHLVFQYILGKDSAKRAEILLVLACLILEMQDTEEAEAQAAARLIFCLHSMVLKIFPCHPGSQADFVVKEAIRRSSHVIELLLHDLNAHGYPNHHLPETRQMTDFLTSVLIDPLLVNSIHSSDMRVVIDIIIRELENLPQGHELLPDYLILLDSILEKSRWSGSEYKKGEIQAIIQLLERSMAGAASSMHGGDFDMVALQSLHFVQSILDRIR